MQVSTRLHVYVLPAVRGGNEGQLHSGHGELEQRCSAAPLLAQYTKAKGARSAKVKVKGAIPVNYLLCIVLMDVLGYEIIENGNAPIVTKLVDGKETAIPPISVEEKAQRRAKLKARSTLLMDLPNEHQLKFNSYKDAKTLMQAIENRYGGNSATKKTQKNLLKQQYENFTASSTEFLRSLSQEWTMHIIMWRNKPEIETLSLDDLFNNLKAYESDVKGTSSSTTNSHNVAFLSSSSTNNASGAVNTAQGVNTASTQGVTDSSKTAKNLSDAMIYSFFASQPRQFARECRAPRNQDIRNKEPTRRTVPVEETTSNALVSQCDGFGYDWSDQVEEGLTNFALMSYSSTCSSSSTNSELSNDSNYLDITELKRKLELVTKEKDEVQLTVQKFENSSKSLSKLLDRQIMDKCKTRLGYNVVPPPYTGNFMPPKHDLVYPSLDDFVDMNESASESVVKKPTIETNEPKTARKEDGAPIIKDWVSESKEEDVPKIKTVEMFNKPSFAKINFVKSTKQVKSHRNTSVDKNKQNTPSPKGNKRN
ncbi:hypothetical protein Tco_1178062 [Tanacetum coccineum]